MSEYPKKKYGAWAGNVNGYKYYPERCAAEVSAGGWQYCQCSRKKGYGLDGLFCKQHAKKYT